MVAGVMGSLAVTARSAPVLMMDLTKLVRFFGSGARGRGNPGAEF